MNKPACRATLLFTLLTMLCMVVQLLGVDYHIARNLDPHFMEKVTAGWVVMRSVNHIADALVLALPLVLLPSRWRWLQWLVVWPLTVWGMAQLLYHPVYRDLMPFSSFLLWQNAGDVLWQSVKGAWRWGYLEVGAPPVALWAAYQFLFKKRMATEQAPRGKRWLAAAAMLVAFVAIRLGVAAYRYHDDNEVASFGQLLHDDYAVDWVRMSNYYTVNGFVPYAVHCAATSLLSHHNMSDDERQEVKRFLDTQPHYTDNSYSAGNGKNLVLIVVESLNSWAINLKINGKEVTPVLNALCADSTAIVARRMKAQVKNGRSSDGLFIYHTGLLPLMTTTVAMAHPDQPYPSLIKALPAGYTTTYVCCDEPMLWNVTKMAANYGYNGFRGKEDIRERMDNNGFIVDKALLDEAAELITAQPQPLAMLIATAGMHQPYNEPVVPTTWISSSGAFTERVRNYLERTAVFDRELGIFLQRLKEAGRYDNSLIVIVSDHNEFVDEDPHGRPALDPEGDNCTLIVLNSGHHRQITDVVGQIDVYPTLLDLLGRNHAQPWKGLGHSLMRHRVTSAALSPTEAAGSSPLLPRQQRAWRVSDLLITSRHHPFFR